jgi:hypothetical protein
MKKRTNDPVREVKALHFILPDGAGVKLNKRLFGW